MFRRSTFTRVLFTGAIGIAFITALSIFGQGDPEDLSVERMVAAHNILMILASGTIFISVLYTLYHKNGLRIREFNELDIAMMGVCFEAFGWIVHRSYWALWRIARDRDFLQLAESMESGAAVSLTIIAFGLMMVGAILVMNPMSRRYLGDHWFFASSIIICALWFGVYHVIELLPSSGL